MGRSADPPHVGPIVLLCPPRSYSTVVAHTLGCHPQLHALSENALLFHPDMDRWRAQCLGQSQFGDGAVRDAAALLFGGLDESALDAADSFLRAAQGSTDAVVDALATAVAPRVLVDKSPLELTPCENLRELARRWPDARYVHLVRHPATAIASMMAFPPARKWANGAMDAMAPLMWWAAHQNSTTFLESLPGDRSVRVRAEDAVNDPEGVFAPVLASWGFRSDAEALGTMLRTEGAPIAERPDLGGGDPSFLASPLRRPAPPPPRQVLPDAAIASPALRRRIAAMARSFGYDVGDDGE